LFGVFITQNREQNGRKMAPNHILNANIEFQLAGLPCSYNIGHMRGGMPEPNPAFVHVGLQGTRGQFQGPHSPALCITPARRCVVSPIGGNYGNHTSLAEGANQRFALRAGP
jgi:hypothetical protein